MRNMLDQYQEEKDHDQQKIEDLMMRLAETVKDNARLKESQKKKDEELTTIKVEKENLESDVNRQKEDVTELKRDFYKFKAEKGDLQEDLKKVLTDKETLQQQLKEEQLKRLEKEKEADKENAEKEDDNDDDADDDKQSPPPSPPSPDLCQKEVKILKEGLFKVTVTAMEYPKEELKNLRKDISTKVTQNNWNWRWTRRDSRLHIKIDLADDIKEKSQKDAAQIRRLKRELAKLREERKNWKKGVQVFPEQAKKGRAIDNLLQVQTKADNYASDSSSESLPDDSDLIKMVDDVLVMDPASNKHQEKEKDCKGRLYPYFPSTCTVLYSSQPLNACGPYLFSMINRLTDYSFLFCFRLQETSR